MTGQIVGTMAYLTPERLIGKPATTTDDLYAVGVVGYEALTGRRPHLQDTPGALARAIMDEQPPPLHVLRPDVDPALAQVINRAMARDPAWRFHDAREMRAALAGLPPVAGRPGTRVLDVPVPPPSAVMALPPAPPPGRNRKLLWLGAIAAAFLLAIVLVAVVSTSGSNPPPAPLPSSTTTTTTTPATTTTTTTTPTTFQQPPPHGPPGKKPKGRGHEE